MGGGNAAIVILLVGLPKRRACSMSRGNGGGVRSKKKEG